MFDKDLVSKQASLVVQWVKNLPAVQETWVRFLGQEDALKKGVATHSNIIAWKILLTEERGGLQSMGSQESDTTQLLIHMVSKILWQANSLPLLQPGKHIFFFLKETQVQSLSQEDPLKEKMASPSNILAWRIPWTEEPGRLQSMGLQRVGHS